MKTILHCRNRPGLERHPTGSALHWLHPEADGRGRLGGRNKNGCDDRFDQPKHRLSHEATPRRRGADHGVSEASCTCNRFGSADRGTGRRPLLSRTGKVASAHDRRDLGLSRREVWVTVAIARFPSCRMDDAARPVPTTMSPNDRYERIKEEIPKLSVGARVLLATAALGVAVGFWEARRLEPDPRGFGTHLQMGLPPFALFEGDRTPLSFVRSDDVVRLDRSRPARPRVGAPIRREPCWRRQGRRSGLVLLRRSSRPATFEKRQRPVDDRRSVRRGRMPVDLVSSSSLWEVVMTTPRPLAWKRSARLGVALLIVGGLGAVLAGCDPRALAYFLQAEDPSVAPTGTDLKGKRVVILTRASAERSRKSRGSTTTSRENSARS